MNFKLSAQLAATVVVTVLWSLGGAGVAGAAVPGTMVVEGLLTSTGGGAAADGSYAAVFSIYNVQTGGSAAWTEGTVQVAVKNGQFTHVLGAKTPITAATLGKLSKAWLGMKIGTDPELPRQPLHSVAYAILADTAATLSCSGCLSATQLGAGAVSADKVSFTYAGSKTKGGPANSAIDLACTGCVSVAEMKFDKDVNLGGNALVAGKVTAKDVAATTVQATSFVGDGSKLTGIKIPSGECKTAGEVVKGINPDGTLKCAVAMDPTALPADGIDEISNYLIHNQFVDKTCGKPNVKIPDNNPTGVADELTFPDIGLAQKLDIDLTVTNSNLAQVTVKVYDPNNVEYTLIAKNVKGTSLTTSFPSKTKPFAGDLTTWVNKNPKGKWRILAVDGAFLNNTTDGAIVNWCVSIQTLSNKKIKVQGDLLVKNTIKGVDSDNVAFAAGVQIGNDTGACNTAKKGTLRWTAAQGLMACDGANWVSAVGPQPMFQGGCTTSGSAAQGTWYNRCINLVSINTAPEYWHTDSKSGTISSNNDYGRLWIDRDGWYEVHSDNYGHMRYMHHYIYVNGVAIGQLVNYSYTNHPRTMGVSKVIYIKKGQYIQVRVHAGGGSSNLWHGTTATLNGVSYSGHNWMTVKYLGPKS